MEFLFVDFLSTRTRRWFCRNRSTCSNNWICGLWLGLLGVFTTSSNFWTQRKSLGEVEVTHILSRVRCLQIPSWSPSGCNKLGAYRKGWLHYILFGRIWILYVEQAVYRPQYTVSWCLFHVFLSYHAKTRCFQVNLMRIFVFLVRGMHRRKEYRLSFVLPVSILNSWWSVNWLHIRYDKSTRKNCSELRHCPVVKEQWDSVLNDLEELGDKEFLVLMDQYNIEIFSCFLRLLPLYTSIFHQTNVEIAQDRSEDNLLISGIQSLHHLLEVDYHDEEECSVASTLDNRWTNNLVVQYQNKIFHW